MQFSRILKFYSPWIAEFKQFLGNKDLDYFDNALDLDKDFNPAQLASKNKKKNGKSRPKSFL